MTGFMRRVVRTQFIKMPYTRPGEGCTKHVLECGHTLTTKQSDGFPKRKHCRECMELAWLDLGFKKGGAK